MTANAALRRFMQVSLSWQIKENKPSARGAFGLSGLQPRTFIFFRGNCWPR